MAIDSTKEVDYFVAEIEYDVVVPVYKGGEYEPEGSTGDTGSAGETGESGS